jgi:hypothetical protein
MELSSYYDSKGHLFVDCAECERGFYGYKIDKCSCGFDVTKKKKSGCFDGTLIGTYKVILEKTHGEKQ